MKRIWFIFIFLAGLLLIPAKTVYAENPVTWQGEIGGVTTWITLVPSGHDISPLTMETEPWWNWGNVSTDSYLFAFKQPENVRLILSFALEDASWPVARLYAAQKEGEPLQYKLQNGNLNVLSNNGKPYITIVPRDGGWLIAGKTNYNLDLFFDGVYNVGFGNQEAHTDGVVDVHVKVGSQIPGIPDWEVDELVNDAKPLAAYPRFGAALRMENAPPFDVVPPVLPGFPYLGIGQKKAYWFQQNPNPIFFSLSNMALETYSFPGSQTGGMYQYNSITSAPLVDFEAPYGFYSFDPSSRYAQLLIRAFHFPKGDPIMTGYNDITSIRYSWKTTDNDAWRYSLQMAGESPYTETVRIGDTEILGISPQHLPTWASTQNWPIVTFVEATNGYGGSEGIYFFAPYEVDWHWLAGETVNNSGYLQAPLLQASTKLTDYGTGTLPAGFRGEYMFANNDPPILYLSPIDNMLHLKDAQAGFWYLGNGSLIRTTDINHDGFVDSWVREEVPSDLDKSGLQRANPGTVLESIINFDGYLLYIKPGKLEFIRSSIEPAAFKIQPPKDKTSWESFRARLSPYEEKQRNPADLTTWEDAFSGPRSTITGASIANLRLDGDTIRFELSIDPDFRVTGPDLLGVAGLISGKYLVVNHAGFFIVKPLLPAELSLDVIYSSSENPRSSVWVAVHNSGLADMQGLNLVSEIVESDGEKIELARQLVNALAGQPARVLVNIPPAVPKGASLDFRLEDAAGQTLVRSTLLEDSTQSGWALAEWILVLSTADGRWLGWLLGIALFAAFPLIVLRKPKNTITDQNI